MSLFPSAPTAGSARPATSAKAAGSAGAAGAASSAGAAGAAGAASAASAAPAWQGKSKILPFVVGSVLALALADTRAAPVVIAVLAAAVVFQLMNL